MKMTCSCAFWPGIAPMASAAKSGNSVQAFLEVSNNKLFADHHLLGGLLGDGGMNHKRALNKKAVIRAVIASRLIQHASANKRFVHKKNTVTQARRHYL